MKFIGDRLLVGESGTVPVPAVVASAVADALSARGVRVEEMPLTPAALRRLVRPGLER